MAARAMHGCSALDLSVINTHCDYRVFAGVIDLDHWPAWGRLLFTALGGRAGDNRHWPDIDAWAEKISHEIRAQD